MKPYVNMLVTAVVVALVAVGIVLLSRMLDTVLIPCGTGRYDGEACVCVEPYTGLHCEIINCGYGSIVASVWMVDTITTPASADTVSGCACVNQWWGVNCDQCTSFSKEECIGTCDVHYYGPRCDVLCMSDNSGQHADIVTHEEARGVANWHEPAHGLCTSDGKVACLRASDDLYFTGDHCEYKCPDCKNGGVCKYDENSAYCDCADGFAGSLCTEECPSRCSGLNGVCEIVDSVATCNCDLGRTGEGCEFACCVRGARTSLGIKMGDCKAGGGCECDAGYDGPECDCSNTTCNDNGVCSALGTCECTSHFNGTRCEYCSEDWVGPLCGIFRKNCTFHGEFAIMNKHGDYGCICDPGFTGADCELCSDNAYPKADGSNQDYMCTSIVPPSMCHNGVVIDTYDGVRQPTSVMCSCSGNFRADTDCATCQENYYGPLCDVHCAVGCFDSGGTCMHSVPGCFCPGTLDLDVATQSCVSCGGDDCLNGGVCYSGRCQCDPGFFGDICEVSAPMYDGKVCNGEFGSSRLTTYDAPCLNKDDCVDTSHENLLNKKMALQVERYKWADSIVCYRTDTPQALRTISGCCVDHDADGRCDKGNLTLPRSECEDVPLVGEYVQDICDNRVLEGEVNVFEWCLSKQKECTKNGECDDPVLCGDYVPGLNSSEWEARWVVDHTLSMETLMSESWRFPVDIEDPYPYRKWYAGTALTDVCAVPGMYTTCRDLLIPDVDVFTFNPEEKRLFRDGWQSMPEFGNGCSIVWFKEYIGLTNKTESLGPFHVDRIHVDGIAVVNAFNSTGDILVGNPEGVISGLSILGKGTFTITLYEYRDDECERLQKRAGRHFSDCEKIDIVELDYDWGPYCKWSNSGVGGFVEHKYAQSLVCAGCEDYQEGCEGLPLTDKPMPDPCDVGLSNWLAFCDVYLSGNAVGGTCARMDCDCMDGPLGIGGAACQFNCPVPRGFTSPCGEGEDPPLGRCVGEDGFSIGTSRGTCECFNPIANPSEGCVVTCDEDTFSCSKDVDTPFTFNSTGCDYENVQSTVVLPGALASTTQGLKPFTDVTYGDCNTTFESYGAACFTDGVDVFLGNHVSEDMTCSLLLPDSVCNILYGRCECATPYSVLSSTGMEYFNPGGNYRVALMQGYGIDEYVPFMTYSPPIPSAMTLERVNTYCPTEDEFRFAGSTCAACFDKPVCYDTSTGVDVFGDTCADYVDGENCGDYNTATFDANRDCCGCGGGEKRGVAESAYHFTSGECVCSEDTACTLFNADSTMYGFIDIPSAYDYVGRGACPNMTTVSIEGSNIPERLQYCAAACSARTSGFGLNGTHCVCTEQCENTIPLDRFKFTQSYSVATDTIVQAWDVQSRHLRCFKDTQRKDEVACSHIRALKHFARGTSYRVGDCMHEAGGTVDQIPCNGRGFVVSGTCYCDYAETLDISQSALGIQYEPPTLLQTPYRGKSCGHFCPGYNMQDMTSVCSGHGVCASTANCDCDQSFVGYKCHMQCELNPGPLTCSGHGTCEEQDVDFEFDDTYELADTIRGWDVCPEESDYLAQDKVIRIDDAVHYMFRDLSDMRYQRYVVSFGHFFQRSDGYCDIPDYTHDRLIFSNIPDEFAQMCETSCDAYKGFNVNFQDRKCECIMQIDVAECNTWTDSSGNIVGTLVNNEKWDLYARTEGDVLTLEEDRVAIMSDYYTFGPLYRKPYGSEEPHMPCYDSVLSTRERVTAPLVDIESTDVKIPCAVLPNYRVVCGACKCFEHAQLGHFTGYNCRTPAAGYYGVRGNRACRGMTEDRRPCNGHGTCNWGSLLGLGKQVDTQTQCFCGVVDGDVTFNTAPRNNDGDVIVHVDNLGEPLYVRTLKYVNSDCFMDGFEQILSAGTCREASAYMGSGWAEDLFRTPEGGCARIGSSMYLTTASEYQTQEILENCILTLPSVEKTYTTNHINVQGTGQYTACAGTLITVDKQGGNHNVYEGSVPIYAQASTLNFDDTDGLLTASPGQTRTFKCSLHPTFTFSITCPTSPPDLRITNPKECISAVTQLSPYEIKTSGTCDKYITTLEECKAARTALGLSDTSVTSGSYTWSRYPRGCISNSGGSDVNFNTNTDSSFDCGDSVYSCLCMVTGKVQRVHLDEYAPGCLQVDDAGDIVTMLNTGSGTDCGVRCIYKNDVVNKRQRLFSFEVTSLEENYDTFCRFDSDQFAVVEGLYIPEAVATPSTDPVVFDGNNYYDIATTEFVFANVMDGIPLFPKIQDSGTCYYNYITTLEECKAARTTLGLDSPIVSSDASSYYPRGCILKSAPEFSSDVYVVFNTYTGSSQDCTATRSCICLVPAPPIVCVENEIFGTSAGVLNTHEHYNADTIEECLTQCVRNGVNSPIFEQAYYAQLDIITQEAGTYFDPTCNFGIGCDVRTENSVQTKCWCNKYNDEQTCISRGMAWIPTDAVSSEQIQEVYVSNPPGRGLSLGGQFIEIETILVEIPAVLRVKDIVCYANDICPHQ